MLHALRLAADWSTEAFISRQMNKPEWPIVIGTLARSLRWIAIGELGFGVVVGAYAAKTVMRSTAIMNQMNRLILSASRVTLFRSGLDHQLIRAAMVFTFFAFSIQKWSQYTSEMLVPLISHSPIVFWLLPAFGVRGAGYFLGTTETCFGCLLLLGYWSPRLGILGALGSIVTFVGTTSIIPFSTRWLGPRGGRISDHDPAARLPSKGLSIPRRVILSAQARSGTLGTGNERLLNRRSVSKRASSQACTSACDDDHRTICALPAAISAGGLAHRPVARPLEDFVERHSRKATDTVYLQNINDRISPLDPLVARRLPTFN